MQRLEDLKAYLYSLWSGQFIVKEITITTHEIHNTGMYRGFSKTKSGKVNQVAPSEGELYNSMVWFKERNDAAASALLLEHAEENIYKLQETIEKYKYKMALIKRGVVEKC